MPSRNEYQKKEVNESKGIFNNTFLLLLIINLCLCKTVSAQLDTILPPFNLQDSLALVNFYKSNNGADWTNKGGWLTGPVRTWFGIGWTSNYINGADWDHVRSISMPNNNIKNTLPSNLLGISTLESINLSGNGLTGSLPSSISKLSKLRNVVLNSNQLSGSVPSLTGLTNLKLLMLNYNQFTFDGLEGIHLIPNEPPYLSPQETLSIRLNNGKFSVYAGGTLSKNTYQWTGGSPYREINIVGDSTFSPPTPGTWSVKVSNTSVPGLVLESESYYIPSLDFNFFIPPNAMIETTGQLKNDISLIDYELYGDIVSTDGVSKLLIEVLSDDAITFKLPNTYYGTFSSLRNQTEKSAEVNIPSVNGKVVVVFNAPDGLGITIKGYRELYFTAKPKNGPETESFLFLVSPPVVLVHGMWSNPSVWQKEGFSKKLENEGLTVFYANYEAHNHYTYDPNSPASLPGRDAVKSAIDNAISSFRMKGVSTAQVDLVCHSLGGLMTRSYSQQPGYFDTLNYFKGAIHKLITLGTPHRGSPFGAELWKQKDNLVKFPFLAPEKLSKIMEMAGQPIGSCHADFGIESQGIKNLKQTPPFKAHAVIGNYKGDGVSTSTQTVGYQAINLLCKTALNKTADEILKSRCTDELEPLPNDLIVPLSSQKGYISNTTLFTGTAHSGPAFVTETNNPALQEKVADLLLSDNSTLFSSGFPAPSSVSLDNCENAAQKQINKGEKLGEIHNREIDKLAPESRSFEITLPTGGSVYLPTSSTSITLGYKVNGATKPASAIFSIPGIAMISAPLEMPYSVSLPLPANSLKGKAIVTLMVRDTAGYLYADTSLITIGTADTIKYLLDNLETIELDSSLRQISLHVNAFYSGNAANAIRDITSANSGTKYLTKKSGICKVSPDGIVEALAPGKDTLTVINENDSLPIPVHVEGNFMHVFRHPDSIRFSSMPDRRLTDGAFALPAFTKSGIPVVYEVISGSGTVANGIITPSGTGQITVRASSSGNAYFNAANPVTRNINILTSGTIYRFTGNGLWSNSQNWQNGIVPPGILPPSSEIIITPVNGGECLLNVEQIINSGAKIIVASGSKLRLSSNLIVQ